MSLVCINDNFFTLKRNVKSAHKDRLKSEERIRELTDEKALLLKSKNKQINELTDKLNQRDLEIRNLKQVIEGLKDEMAQNKEVYLKKIEQQNEVISDTEFRMKKLELDTKIEHDTTDFEKMVNEQFNFKDTVESISFPMRPDRTRYEVKEGSKESKKEKILRSPHIISTLTRVGLTHSDLELEILQQDEVLDFFLELANTTREIMNDRKIPKRVCYQCSVLKKKMSKLINILSKPSSEMNALRELIS
ncbi:unnamed protein product [Moneuplotes crassus]|uniref:Uncharacterized protein n=1 Tax=Euplotes crassus TaxID=5936 RepID=A0AAD1XSD0_EUPCR|nr:unnamed protein product [Moneuplotes crassus]CAI2377952.1 unnamed protein product [Moneuplotes crassus]